MPTYLHKRSSDLPPAVGVLVEYTGEGDAAAEAARGAAMQVAALKAKYVTRDEVPADLVDTERRIAEETAREEGKPEQALPKIVEGRVNGFFKDVVLTEQSSVTDCKKTVKAILDEAGVTITRFVRFEVGAYRLIRQPRCAWSRRLKAICSYPAGSYVCLAAAPVRQDSDASGRVPEACPMIAVSDPAAE